MKKYPPSHAPLVSAYRQMQRMMVDADVYGLMDLLASDFILLHMTGYPQPREEWLRDMENQRMRYFSSHEEQISVVELDADHARLIGRNEVLADIWGIQGAWHLQLDMGLQRVDGQWKIASAVASSYR